MKRTYDLRVCTLFYWRDIINISANEAADLQKKREVRYTCVN